MNENNTLVVNAQTGEVTETYTEPIEMPTYTPTREDYEQLVSQKIRAKYSASEELAILRQRDDKPNEWKEYYDYCEQCKVEAKEELEYKE